MQRLTAAVLQSLDMGTEQDRGRKLRACILAEIRRRRANHLPPPTLDDLAKACGRGINTVRFHLIKLRDSGDVGWETNQARTLRTLKD